MDFVMKWPYCLFILDTHCIVSDRDREIVRREGTTLYFMPDGMGSVSVCSIFSVTSIM
jgi:hypothetical protein